MWTKTSKPAAEPTASRTAAPARPVAVPARPSRVLQPGRVPQQLAFEFRRS